MAFCNDCTSGSFIDWFSGYTLDDCANYGFYPGYDLNDWLNNEWNYDFSSWDYKQPASDVSSSLSTCAFSSAASSPSPNSDFSSTSLSLEEFKSVFSSSVNNFNCGFNTLKSNESGNGKKVAFSLPSTPAPVQERLAPLNFSQTGSVAAPTKTASTKEAIKVTKTSRVNPATNSSHDSLLLPLTFFDLRWIKFHPTERVLFYKLHKHSSYHSLILPKLEHSLSTVLHHYLPLVGRLRWDPQDPKPHILVLPNDYVTLIVAESDADFSLLSRKGTRPETEIRSLVPELPASRDDSVFVLALQVTLFPNQGFSIGVTAHHSAMDGRSMSMFVRSWAHVCKHGTIGELTPCLDRTVINVPASLDARILEVVSYFSEDKTSSRSLKLPPSEEISPDTVRITLELTRENVEKLKERAKNESTRSHLHLSTFVVANAYLWSCLVKARGGDADRPVRFMYAADFRNRLGSPVPESYFGSCVLSVGCFGHKAGVVSGEDGFVNAVEIISDSVRGVGSLDVEALCELYIDGTMRVEPGTQTVSIVGSNRFGLYQSDFGWGKPVACETVSIDRNEAFSMSERRDESGGVEIGLCLKKCEMDLFIDLFQNGL